MVIGKSTFAVVLLILLIGFAVVGKCCKPLNAFLKRHRKEYGIIDTLYALFLFCILNNVLEAYMNWLVAGGISIAVTALTEYVIYSEREKGKGRQ